MPERFVPFLKVLIVVLVIALVVVTGGLVRYVLFGGQGTGTPRTELERAVFSAEEAVRADPQNPSARVKLAAAYLEENAVGAAIGQANIAIRLAPKDPTGYYILGLCQDKSGDLQSATANLTKAATMKGQIADFYSDVYAALARVLEKDGKQNEAFKMMGKAIENSPENALLLYSRGQMDERAKKWMFALDDYSSAVQFVPDYQEARDAYNRVARDHPDALKKLLKYYAPGSKKAKAKAKKSSK